VSGFWAFLRLHGPAPLVPVLHGIQSVARQTVRSNGKPGRHRERRTDVSTPCFEDGIGRRWRSVDPAGGEIETLVLSPALVDSESTEAVLVERVAQLATFSHPAFAPVRRIERLSGTKPRLAIVSAAVSGVRLSDMLRDAQRQLAPPDLDATCSVLGQVVTALADLHRHSRDLAHGAIGPERIVITPDGRAVIVESVLAPVLERLQLARTPLWTDFRVAVPPVAGTPRFDQVTDVMQVGMLALALVLGRLVRRDEYPSRLHDLMLEASMPGGPEDRQAILRALREWIHRTLQLAPRSAFRTAAEAAPAFDAVLAERTRHDAPSAPAARQPAGCVIEAAGDWKVPALLSTPAGGGAWSPPVGAGKGAVPPKTSRRTGSPGISRSRLTTGKTWTGPVSEGRVAILVLALVTLFGVAYLGARGYLVAPSPVVGRGTVVIESSPPGVEVFVDGLASGRTPATLDLNAGEHTVVLRAGRAITLVPVVAVAGTRRVERVDIRQRQPTRRPAAAARPSSLPARAVPQ
jgi:hypothetical protein